MKLRRTSLKAAGGRSSLEIFDTGAERKVRAVIPALIAVMTAVVPAWSQHLMSPSRLASAAEYSAARDGCSLIVFQRGKLVLEEYSNGSSTDTPHRIASITKNLWGLLALAAVHDRILDLDEKVSDTVREWRTTGGKNAITVRDLLSMVSGLDPGFKELYFRKPVAAPRTAIMLPMRDAPPGSAFQYGPANMEAFGELLKRKLKPRGISPLEYLEKRILAPVGISYDDWKTDRSGNPAMSGGAKMRARDLLRLGMFILQHGKWEESQLIGSPLFASIRGTYANPMYGLTFWLNKEAGFSRARELDIEEILEAKERFEDWQGGCISKSAPADMITMLGSGNQRVYVVPSLGLVIVRQGNGRTFLDREFWRLLGDSYDIPRFLRENPGI